MRQGPPQSAIRAELERITASRYFAGAERLSRFLRYIVTEAMEGRGGQIKEYAVGVEVYGRKPDYDPKSDAIVRVEAGRLRIKLEQYYAREGRDDAVQIEVPRRSYAPALSWRALQEAPHQLRLRWLYAATAVLVVAATVGLFYWRTWRAGSQVRFFSLAVLPLVNLSAGDEMERFGDSLTEEITNRLAATEGLRVAARTSASQYKDKPRDISSIGRALNVIAVLEGSVQHSGSHVRVTAQLVATADGYHLWSEEYEKDAANLLEFQTLAASTIARTLGSRFAGLTAAEARQTTRSQKALNLYLKGHEAWLTQKRPGLLQSVDYYQKALAEDPGYADAYAGLAAAELYLDSLDPQPNQWTAKARDAATRALALNDRLADVHARLGNIYLYTDWDFAAAEHELRRSVQLHPGLPEVERWFALVSCLREHYQPALDEMEIGLMVNPSSELMHAAKAQIYLTMGRPADAEKEASLAVALAPGDALCRQMLGLAVERRGNCKEAIGHFRGCMKSLTDDLRCRPSLAHAEAVCGQTAQARTTAAELDSQDNLSAALVNVGLGENARALDQLERSYERREADLPFVKLDPRFDPVRGDPRFQTLLARLQLRSTPH